MEAAAHYRKLCHNPNASITLLSQQIRCLHLGWGMVLGMGSGMGRGMEGVWKGYGSGMGRGMGMPCPADWAT